MRRLLFFVFFVLIPVLLYAQPPPKWKQTLQELKQEKLNIELQLKAIGDELQTTKDALTSLEIEHGKMKSSYEGLKKNRQSRIELLEKQRSQLVEDKSKAERQIRLWKGIAIGSGIVAVGTLA